MRVEVLEPPAGRTIARRLRRRGSRVLKGPQKLACEYVRCSHTSCNNGSGNSGGG